MNQLPPLQFIDWNEFHHMGFELSKRLNESCPDAETIISVARGGHVLARLLSDFLKLPIFSVSIQSYQDLQQLELRITQELNIDLKGHHVLLIDEIVDSGKTLVRALEYLSDFGPSKVTSVAMHVKPGAIARPDYYVDETDKWVVYPYEVRETIEALEPIWRKAGVGREHLEAELLAGGIRREWVEVLLPRLVTA